MAPLSIHCKKMLNELSHFRGPLQSTSRTCLSRSFSPACPTLECAGYKKAVPRLEQALSQQSDNYEALLYLSLSHAGSEHYELAHTYFEKLVGLHPEDIEALNQLGRNYLELSTVSFKRMWDVAPKGFIYFRTLGQLGESQGKPAAEIQRQYERAIAARPDYPNLHWN